MKDSAAIERLRAIEFNSRIETIFRFSVILVAGVAVYFYTRWPISLVWLGVYFALHLLYWRALLTFETENGKGNLRLLVGVYLAVLFVFASFPVYLTTDDHVTSNFTGTAACICLAMYLIWRGDTVPCLIYGEIAVMAVAVGVITAVFTMAAETAGHRALMVVCGLAVWGYFVLALMTLRFRAIRFDRAAQRAAETRKMEAVGRLAGGIAHDFNNILTAIQGNLELYREESDPAERHRLVAEAHKSSRRAAELTRNLLIYARHAPLQCAPVPVKRLLDQAARLSRGLVPLSFALKVAAPPGEERITVDEAQLMTALVNLVSNAHDAMADLGEQGGVLELAGQEVVLTARRHLVDGATLGPGRYLAISVADTGRGIPPELLRRVAEPFFTTKPVDQGSGLGLATVSGFAIQSGGGLHVESTGTGTRATIFLPWPEAPARVHGQGAEGSGRADSAKKPL